MELAEKKKKGDDISLIRSPGKRKSIYHTCNTSAKHIAVLGESLDKKKYENKSKDKKGKK